MDAQETSALIILLFSDCSKYQKVLSKLDMDDINKRADKVIKTFYMNSIEIEKSQNSLNKRKDKLHRTHQRMLYSSLAEITVIVAISWWQVYYLTSSINKRLPV